MSTIRSSYELRNIGRPLIVGDEILFSTNRYKVAENLRGYYLWSEDTTNTWIFDAIGIKIPALYCRLPEGNSGLFPYHTTLGHLTATVDNLLIDFQKKQLHTFDWNNYTPSKSIKDIPIEYVKRMCCNQVLQGNPFNLDIFENGRLATKNNGGFDWYTSKEGYDYWMETLSGHNQTSEKSGTVTVDTATPEIIILKRNNTKTFLIL